MDVRYEDTKSIQVPSDGSLTERVRGTFGGRQRWLTNASNDESLITTRGNIVKITGPAIENYLNTLGVGNGDEADILKREADEITELRRGLDEIVESRKRKEAELAAVEEQLAELRSVDNSRKNDGALAQGNAIKLEARFAQIESKLEDELADRSVYKHMAQRLKDEVQTTKKSILSKENQIQALQNEISANHSTLLSARQEKAAAEIICKSIAKEIDTYEQDNTKVMDDLLSVLEQTQYKAEILKKREASKSSAVIKALSGKGLQKPKKTKLEKEAVEKQDFDIQKAPVKSNDKLKQYETDFARIAEAAGTADVDSIVLKYNTREKTSQALKNEYADAEARIKRLRDKERQLRENLSNMRGVGINTRGVYQEMESTASQLEEVEKHSQIMSKKWNRVKVILDSIRSSMQKNIEKLSSVQGVMEFGEEKLDASKVDEASTGDLVQAVEQKLHAVIDAVNREKAELELHRAEAMQGLRRPESAEKIMSIRQPAHTETEEHFILRTSSPDTSAMNIRVGPERMKTPVDVRILAGDELIGEENAVDDDLVIDRATRKKLAGMMINRGKKSRKSSQA